MTKGTKMTRGDKTVTAYKPTTIVRLRSQGWKPAAKPVRQPVLPAPKETVERPTGNQDTDEK